MKTLYVTTHPSDANHIRIDELEKDIPKINPDECLIQVASSAINPSDALAAMGYFKHAKLPRIPGRDFAGTIVEGASHLIGKKVWGTGGDAGIGFDGTQAAYIKLSTQAIAEIPNNMDLLSAGGQTLPYVTAYYGLVNQARIKEEESVLVVGALGQVGQAAMSILKWRGCKAVALVRGSEEVEKANHLGWNAVNSEGNNLYERLRQANGNLPFSVILNSIGNLYWAIFMRLLADFGRIVTLSARENNREAVINLFDLYRANQQLLGINTVFLDFAKSSKLLNALKPGFEANQLTPLPIHPEAVYSLQKATQGYLAVLKESDKRVVIKF